MRLYLSSFLFGAAPDELVKLVGQNTRCALILNALDNAADARERFAATQTEGLTALGFACEELDLRLCFGRPQALAAALDGVGMLWITGGNAFLLRKAMRQSGLDTMLPELLARDALVYAGFSAAAVITCRDLTGLTPTPASYTPPAPYDAGLIWDGLAITPYAIVVHHDSDHPGRAAAAHEAAYYRDHAIPHRLLRDGEALIIANGETRVVGRPTG